MEEAPKSMIGEIIESLENRGKERKLQKVTDNLCAFVAQFDLMEDSRPGFESSVNAGFDDENYISTLQVLDHQNIDDIALQIGKYVSEQVNPSLESFRYSTRIEGKLIVTQLQVKGDKLG